MGANSPLGDGAKHMALKKYKPITAGTRWRIGNAYAEITTNEPEKSLVEIKTRTGGRNSSGRRAMRYIGGGHKKMYRVIDFKRNKKNIKSNKYKTYIYLDVSINKFRLIE